MYDCSKKKIKIADESQMPKEDRERERGRERVVWEKNNMIHLKTISMYARHFKK